MFDMNSIFQDVLASLQDTLIGVIMQLFTSFLDGIFGSLLGG